MSESQLKPSSDFVEPASDAMAHQIEPSHPLVSVIVPTYREAENLPVLIPQVHAALQAAGMSAELLVVDDNSPDETPQVCAKLAEEYPLRLIIRTTDRGLSPSVIEGMSEAKGDVLLVMDADLSHPPEKVPELVAAILEDQGEFVIGSRYVPGGSTDDEWSLFRLINSKVATWLSRGLTTSQDPMAGFFAISRKKFVEAESLNPIGYKIGLELIVKCRCDSVAEIPIHFRDRLHGESKLTFKEQLNYLRHLWRLYKFKFGDWLTFLSFGAVGASGMIVDLLLLTLLMTLLPFAAARAVAIGVAMTWNFFGNRMVTFSDRKQDSAWKQYLLFCGSCSLGAVVSWTVSTALWTNVPNMVVHPMMAAMCGIAAAFVLNFLFCNVFVFRKQTNSIDNDGVANPPVESDGDELKKKSTDSKVAGLIGTLSVMCIAMAISAPSLFRAEIDGLDQAHNLLTSMFFYDFYRDLPVSNPIGYTYDYQRQYPALGLTFWPPLFHSIAGAAMLITGPQIETVRFICMLFVGLFAVSLFRSSSRSLPTGLAVLVVAVTLTTPLVYGLSNTTMLEMPSMAMAMLTLWLYVIVKQRGAWQGVAEAILAGALCAAVAYTKQPAIFVLLGILLDVSVSHRKLLKQPLTWLAVGACGLFVTPLVLFTLKFGKVNIAQSIGNAGNIYVEHHRVADRWSLEGWTYYLDLMAGNVSWLLLGFAALAIGGLLFSREQRQTHGIWLWCLFAWYLLFSYFDNKQVRFLAYAVPFLAILAGVTSHWMLTYRRWLGMATVALLIGVSLRQAVEDWQSPPVGYHQMRPLVTECLRSGESGNFACFGNDHHLLTTQLRLQDEQREHHNLRGDDLLETSENSLVQAMIDYRVRWLWVQPELEIGQEALRQIQAASGQFEQVMDLVKFDNSRKSFDVLLYRYTGEIAPTMKQIPLRSQVQQIAAQ